jgi:hypothetical protein
VSRASCGRRDDPHAFWLPAPRHGSGSRPHAPDPTVRGAIRGHAAPPAVGGDLVPVPFPGVPSSLSKNPAVRGLLSPLSPPSSCIVLSPLSPPLSPRGSRRRQRLRRRSFGPPPRWRIVVGRVNLARLLLNLPLPSPASDRRRPVLHVELSIHFCVLLDVRENDSRYLRAIPVPSFCGLGLASTCSFFQLNLDAECEFRYARFEF